MLGQRRYEDIFGHLVPYIRIKDYVLKRDEILKFTLESKDFLPTISLHVSSPTKSLSRENMPVDGDRISIGIREDLATFKPISSDFIITSITASPQKDNLSSKRKYYEYYITGKLFVPNLNNNLDHFTYTGYAEDALKEMCIRLGLGYVHSKNVKTAKKESWHCYDDPVEFIQNVTSHMWLAKDSFFDSWVDPRRNLTVVNVNDMLGRRLSDDGEIDFTKYKNVNGSIGEDGKYVSNDLMDLKDTKFPKMFCNDPQFEGSMWYPIKYQYKNNSTNVSKALGPQRNFEVYVQNNGVGQSIKEARHTIEIGVWYMQEKLDLGYVIANGPTNYSKDFKMADNGSWKDENTKAFAPILMPIESDSDEDSKSDGKSNINTSGNFSKEYVIAPEHNKINLAELDKQKVIVTTYGANLGIARGEKVPCFLYNRSNEKYVSETRSTKDTGFEFDMVCSGWFYVKAVELVYQPNFKPDNFVTDWKTNVTLTRREWFPPESTATKKEAEEYGIVSVDVATGTSVESSTSDIPKVSNPSDDTSSSKIPAITDNPAKPDWDVESLESSADNTSNVINELGGMYDEAKENMDKFMNTINANSIMNSLTSLKDAIGKEGDSISLIKDTINNTISKVSLSDVSSMLPSLDLPSTQISILENTKSSIESQLSSLEETIRSKSIGSLTSGNPIGEDMANNAKTDISNITSSASSLASSIQDNVNNTISSISSQASSLVNGVKEGLDNMKNEVSSKLESVKSLLDNAKTSASNIVTNIQDKNTGKITEESTIIDDSESQKDLNIEESMAYDSNGLKHFMNEFISVMNSEGIPYVMKGTRRWALDKNDNKVYGNAFTMRETSEIYKTLDSDGNMYWLSDYNSRHYYGEAIDIEPSSSFDDLLEKICLSKPVLDCMHKYGICIQLEVSKSGHSKGSHFHCSTSQDNSQTKWWGIVNKKRSSEKLSTYVVILKRDYYEKETKNDIVVV